MIQKKYDVIVAGGGTAGFSAAIAAARNGAKTLVIEQNGYLGGTSTMGVPFLAVFDGKGNQVVGGILEEVVQRLVKEHGGIGHVHGTRWSNGGHMMGDEFSLTPFDSEIFKYVAQEMVLEAGAEILYHTSITGVTKDGDRISGVDVFNASGFGHLDADVVIDCSGDADICHYAGARMLKKEKVQNSSILFVMMDVDIPRFEEALEQGENIDGWGWWHSRVVAAKKLDTANPDYVHIAGHFKPFGDDREVTFTAVSVRKGEVYLNASRVAGIDATDAESLTQGEIQERRNIHELVNGLKANVPGFENAFVSRSSDLGIRESRTVIGDYILTGDDVFNHKPFADTIARGAYPADIHDPKGGRTQFTFIKDGISYGIPYRCLLPAGIEQLLVAGRTISATQDANGTIRLQATVVAQGQAAGTAAALSVKHGISPRKVDVQELRALLSKQGAII